MIKKTVSILIVIAMIFGFSACGKDQKQTIKIGLLSIDDSLPFFMAEKLGLYEEYGVDVELVPFGSAADKELALEAGELDGDMTDLIVTALLKQGGTDVKIVSIALGAVASEGRFAILGAPGSDLDDPTDLAGIEVAVGNNTIVHYLSDKIQSMEGTDESLILSQNIPSLSMRYEALMNGSIKAAVLPDPLASLALANGASLVFDDTKSTVNLSQSVVIFTEEALENKFDEICGVMEAYFTAMEYINANPDADDVRDAIKEFCSVPDELFDSYATPSYTPNVLPDEEIIEDTMQWMLKKGLIEKAYTYDEMVY